MGNIKRLFLFLTIILTQCAWSTGWQQDAQFNIIQSNGQMYPGLVATTNQTLIASQTGNTVVFNNSAGSAANGTQFTLPAATVGLDYTIVADTAKWFYVQPQASDIINFAGMSTGLKMNNRSSAAIGDSVGLICVTAGQWTIYERQGTWAAGA